MLVTGSVNAGAQPRLHLGRTPRLGRLGIQLVDVPFASLDLSSCELVVPDPVIAHDAAVLDEVDEGVGLGSELPSVRPGRYPLAGWYLSGDGNQGDPLSTAVGVASVAPLLRTDDLVRSLEELPALFERAPIHALQYSGPEDLARQLRAAL